MRGPLVILLGVVAGCTALNPAFGDRDPGGRGTGGEDAGADTSVPPPATSTSTTHATSSDDGDATGPMPLDVGVGEADTGSGATSTTGAESLCATDVMVIEDAFLVSCGGACSGANFGGTPARGLGQGSHLLLRLPSSREMAVEVELTVSIVPQVAALDGGFELGLYAITPPCAWSPGNHQGTPPQMGESAVTWDLCDAADATSFWGDDALSALAVIDDSWEPDVIAFDANSLSAELPTNVTLTIARDSPGLVPESLVLMSTASPAETLVASAAEGPDPMVATIIHVCR